ncbi:MAG: glycosyltransferase family 2 protein [Planctomycetaceae bacterium]|nr:glycosyltransferase family 2 protein [Planctomycetaceae bacterium]
MSKSTKPDNTHSPLTAGGSVFMKADLSDVVVIIPALNEQESLPMVLQAIPETGRVIVVDNASEDQTAAVAAKHGADVVKENRRGYGAACLAGLAYLEANIPDCKIIVFLDGDFSDSPEKLLDLVAPIHENQADFVLGSRLTGQMEPGAMPPQARFGNQLATFLIWLLLGKRFTDLGPFRAIRRDSLNQLKMCDQNFGWTVEMQIKAVEHRLRILEIPVPYRVRIGTSKISGTVRGTVLAGYKILLLIAIYGLPACVRRFTGRKKN